MAKIVQKNAGESSMRKIGHILSILFIIGTFLNPSISFSQIRDCVHSHICCKVGCSCCSDSFLNSNPKYETVHEPNELIGKWKFIKIINSDSKFSRGDDSLMLPGYNWYFDQTYYFLELKENGRAWTILNQTSLHEIHWEVNKDSSITLFTDSAKSYPMNQLQYVRQDWEAFKIIRFENTFFTKLHYGNQLLTIQIAKVTEGENIFSSNPQYTFNDTIFDCSSRLNGRYRLHKDYISCAGYKFYTSDSVVVYSENGNPMNKSGYKCDRDTLGIKWYLTNHKSGSVVNVFKIENDPHFYQIFSFGYNSSGFSEIFCWDSEGKNLTKTMIFEMWNMPDE